MNVPKPPIAKKMEHRTEIHGEVLLDDYYWLRDRENPEVISYLEAENTYTASVMAHTEEEQAELYKEMLSRINETDLSAPYRKGDYWYYTRTVEGQNYVIRCRKKGNLEAPEEILLDENKMAEGHKYFAVGAFEVSPNHKLIAFSVDTSGNERYTVHVRNLETGEELAEKIADTYYSLEWANDNKTLFYDRVDETTRPFKLFRHVLGTPIKDDVEVFHEADDRYFLGLHKSRSEKFLVLSLESKLTTEVHFLDANTPAGAFTVVEPRKQGHEYHAEHHGDDFFILSNDGATNFKMMKTPVAKPGQTNWKEVIAHNPEVSLTGIEAFKDFLVIEERRKGLPSLRIRDLSNNDEHWVEMPEPAYSAGTTSNHEYDTSKVRLSYTSLVSPRSVYDYDVNERKLTLVKEMVVFHYDRTKFESQRIEALASDGTKIPISIVYKKGLLDAGAAPMLLVGYGSYGASYDPYFSSARVSLLERGVVFGIAHIRGGGELGRPWYDDGKLFKKMNTFTDFITCANHLISRGITAPEKLAISGGSAGGLLMGAVANMRPSLFKVVVAEVPFVDVVNTMLDETIPLTVTEYEEWGNPNDKAAFEYIRQYSPYDNVEEKNYPHMLITAGLNDPRVQYWEPAKWTAKLRAMKTGSNQLILKTNMGAGHGGASGRYDYLKEIAFENAFILDRLGLL